MITEAEMRPNVFNIWLSRMADELGVEKVTQVEAAKMLGKSERMIGYYMKGYDIPRDTSMLMEAFVQGFRPKPFGHK